MHRDIPTGSGNFFVGGEKFLRELRRWGREFHCLQSVKFWSARCYRVDARATRVKKPRLIQPPGGTRYAFE